MAEVRRRFRRAPEPVGSGRNQARDGRREQRGRRIHHTARGEAANRRLRHRAPTGDVLASQTLPAGQRDHGNLGMDLLGQARSVTLDFRSMSLAVK